MRALSTAARHEAIRALRNRTVRIAAALVAALLVAAFLLEAARHTEEARQRAAFQELVHRQWVEQPDRHPHRAAHYGSFAFRDPSPLGFFDPGLESFAGTSIFLEPHQRNTLSFSEAAQSSELARFGTPSAAFVLQVLLPLLIFCMTFASVAGERESGTWRLAVSQGVDARVLIAGKVLGTLLAVALWLAPLLALALAGALLTGVLDGSSDTLLRAAGLAGGYAVYLAACTALGVLVSSFHRRAQGALLTLLGLWVALWIVVPRLATQAASRLHPTPSRAQVELDLARAMRDVGDSHDPSNPHFQELRRRTLAAHGASRVEDLPVNYGGVVMREGEKVTTAVFNDYYTRLFEAHRAQDGLALRAGLFTPLLAIRSFSMGLAGTDAHHLVDFEEQAEAHRYAFSQHLNQLHITKIRWQNDKAQRVDRAEWSEFAPFQHRRPPAAWALSRVAPAGLAVLAWAAALSLGVALFTRRHGEAS
ncbi:ABC transporter permease [Sorangium sp. So ce1153]|uniref:ABC transporter permease n=1 Tax=Sorangium sp. So ce1153 TaxID=3133333 RepID=UPI003F5EB320